jgi:hypothetical protein
MSGNYSSLGSESVVGSVPVAAAAEHVLPFQDSNLQTFPPSDNRGKVAGSFQPPRDADGMQPSTIGGYSSLSSACTVDTQCALI